MSFPSRPRRPLYPDRGLSVPIPTFQVAISHLQEAKGAGGLIRPQMWLQISWKEKLGVGEGV
jgi:hypothetical protein